MSDSANIRVSFIGAGGICEQRHLPGLAQIPGVELVAVCNRSVESSERIKQQWNFERTESDWRKIIDDPTVDAIFIGTWPYMHRELSIAALAAGKHVFCQARMCLDWNEAQQMTAAAAAHPQLVSVVCPSPFRVRWERTVKQVLASPDFGPLQMVNVDVRNNANGNPNQISWREQSEYSGLNILQVGIFAETLNAWCGEYATLLATSHIDVPIKTDATGRRRLIKVPQTVRLRGKLVSGALSSESHTGLWSQPERSEITLFGAQKTCIVDLVAGNVQLHLKQGPTRKQIVDATGDPWQVEAEFIEAVRAARRSEPWQTANHINPNFAEASRYMLKMQRIHDVANAGDAKLLDEPPPGN